MFPFQLQVMFMVYPFIPRFSHTHTKDSHNQTKMFRTISSQFSPTENHQTPSPTSSKRLQQFFRYLLPCWAQELNQLMGVSCPKTGPATGSQTGRVSWNFRMQLEQTLLMSGHILTLCRLSTYVVLCTVLISLNLKCQVFWRRWNRMPYVHRFLLLSACRIHLLVQGRRWPSQTMDFWDAPGLGS